MRDQHPGLDCSAEKEVRERPNWLALDTPCRHAALEERNDDAEAVRHVYVARLLPSKNGWSVEKDDTARNRVEAAIEEHLATCLQLVHRVVDVLDNRPDLVRKFRLELGHHGPQQSALVTKVMVDGALGYPGPRHDVVHRDRSVAAITEERARRNEQRARGVSGARCLPALAFHTRSM